MEAYVAFESQTVAHLSPRDQEQGLSYRRQLKFTQRSKADVWLSL